jgi:uncharacterized protein YqeY
MNIKEELAKDLKEAMRAQEQTRKRTIRLALAAIKNAEIDNQAELQESDVLVILQKELKSRYETIEGAEQAGREDLIDEANEEIAVLKSYLPQELSLQEIEAIVSEVIDDIGASSMREMGQVMQNVMPKVRGRADGKEVSQIVRKLLSS